MFRAVGEDAYSLSGVRFFRAKLESEMSALGFVPGSYNPACLLVADTNPSADKLKSFAAKGAGPVVVPHDDWFSGKWIVAKGIVDLPSSVIPASCKPFFR